MRIKLGDYVRSKLGKIIKVDTIEYSCNNHIYYGNEYEISEENVSKHGKEIVDLIEVGDVINCNTFVEKHKGKLGTFCILPNGKWEFVELDKENVEYLITREQLYIRGIRVGE